MSDNYNVKPSAMFWVLGVLFLLWGLMGCAMYLAEVMMSDKAYGEAFGQDLLAVRHVYPVWAMAGYASAVWSGLLAAILLFTNSILREAAGPSFWVMPLIVVVLGSFEVWYSRKQSAKGVLR